MIFKIPDLDPKLNTCVDLVSKLQCAQVYEIWHSGQIERTHYEYSTWNWWCCPKIIDSGKLGCKIEMFSNFLESWHSGHIWYANYQYSRLNG